MFETFHLEDPGVQRLIVSVLVVVVMAVLTKLAQRLILTYINEPARRYHASKLIGRTAAVVTVILIIGVWTPNLQHLLTILTVIGAGLAIAMREAVLSLIGWFNITLRNLYKQGDRIEMNGVRGDVVDIRLMHTTLMEIGSWIQADQSTGRLMHIPNSWIFQHALMNYNRGFNFIWNEFSVTVTFRSDWENARDIILRYAQESAAIVEKQAAAEIEQMSRSYLVHYSILSPFVYVRIMDNGIRLTLRYLCEARKRRGTEHALTISILQAFAKHGNIELAYPMVGMAPMLGPQFGPIAENGSGEADLKDALTPPGKSP